MSNQKPPRDGNTTETNPSGKDGSKEPTMATTDSSPASALLDTGRDGHVNDMRRAQIVALVRGKGPEKMLTRVRAHVESCTDGCKEAYAEEQAFQRKLDALPEPDTSGLPSAEEMMAIAREQQRADRAIAALLLERAKESVEASETGTVSEPAKVERAKAEPAKATLGDLFRRLSFKVRALGAGVVAALLGLLGWMGVQLAQLSQQVSQQMDQLTRMENVLRLVSAPPSGKPTPDESIKEECEGGECTQLLGQLDWYNHQLDQARTDQDVTLRQNLAKFETDPAKVDHFARIIEGQ
jgi:hypothetical protein